MATSKMKLVTVIASFELQERVIESLRKAGAKGYTLERADGRGRTGGRKHGVFEPGNARIESIMAPAVATKFLERISADAEEFGFIAFAYDVEAVPASRFG